MPTLPTTPEYQVAAPTTSTKNALRAKPKPKPFPLNLYQTAVGKKWVMAITGLILFGFVIAHMIGNLKLYLGLIEHNGEMAYDIDIYSEFLRQLLVPILPEGVVLWLLRIGLIAAMILHIHSAYTLNRMNQASNNRYESKRDYIAANFASRTMRYTGPIILLYVVVHLLDLTIGKTFIASDEFVSGDVYANVVHSLSRPAVAIGYIVANIAVCVHLFHGVSSAFQTLGVNNPSYNNVIKNASAGIVGLILIGNLSFPIAVLAGVVDL